MAHRKSSEALGKYAAPVRNIVPRIPLRVHLTVQEFPMKALAVGLTAAFLSTAAFAQNSSTSGSTSGSDSSSTTLRQSAGERSSPGMSSGASKQDSAGAAQQTTTGDSSGQSAERATTGSARTE